MADVLNPDALHHELDRLQGWGGTTQGLEKRFTFADFNGSVAFVNRVAAVADELDHHPDVTISWNTVTLRLVTHSSGGVTQSDIELARRIDPLATDDPAEARNLTSTDVDPARPQDGGATRA
jgi:4a-hydroxytetrahydrobiopterin dehydratase